MPTIRSILRILTGTFLVAGAFWNIWGFNKSVVDLPPRDSELIVAQENRFQAIREKLKEAGYRSGNIAFITNRDLNSGSKTIEDDNRWPQAQYVMVPWILLRGKRTLPGAEIANADTPFVIGDFWQGDPPEIPKDLLKLYDSGKGLMLFRREPAQ